MRTITILLLTIFILTPLAIAQYGDPGPPPAPDTPRAEDPREIESYDPAFAPNPVLDAPNPALDQDSAITEPRSFDLDPAPGEITTDRENIEIPPGGIVTEPETVEETTGHSIYTEGRSLPVGPEAVVEGDPLVRQPRGLVEEGDPLVEQPDPLVRQPAPLVEEADPLVEQPPAVVE